MSVETKNYSLYVDINDPKPNVETLLEKSGIRFRKFLVRVIDPSFDVELPYLTTPDVGLLEGVQINHYFSFAGEFWTRLLIPEDQYPTSEVVEERSN